MTTMPEPMPGEDPGVPPDEQAPDVVPSLPDDPGPAADPGAIPVTEPELP